MAISGVRVFGIGSGNIPAKVKNITVDRKTDKRDVMLTWEFVPNAQGYNVLWSIAPDKIYNSWFVYVRLPFGTKKLNGGSGILFYSRSIQSKRCFRTS